jgi:hypothetical protein
MGCRPCGNHASEVSSCNRGWRGPTDTDRFRDIIDHHARAKRAISAARAAFAEQARLDGPVLHALDISLHAFFSRFFHNTSARVTRDPRAPGLGERDYLSWHFVSLQIISLLFTA